MNTLPGSVKNIYIVELFTLPVNSEFCCKPRKKEKPLSAFAWQGKEKGACTGSAPAKEGARFWPPNRWLGLARRRRNFAEKICLL